MNSHRQRIRSFLEENIKNNGFLVKIGALGKANITKPVVVLNTPVESYTKIAQSPPIVTAQTKITAEIFVFEKVNILDELDQLADALSPSFLKDLKKSDLVDDIFLEETSYALDAFTDRILGVIRLSFLAYYEMGV